MNTLVTWSIGILVAAAVEAHAQNTVKFDNQSGQAALVRLLGPTSQEIEVPDGATRSVAVAAGQYIIKVRYGTTGHYRYTKGDDFVVGETTMAHSVTTITLHKVVSGNYEARPSTEAEFGATGSPRIVQRSSAQEKAPTPTVRTAGATKRLLGEEAAVDLLGFRAHYADLFSPGGVAIVAMSGENGKTVAVKTYYEPSTQAPIGFSWAPQPSEGTRLTKQQVIDRCGAPEKVAPEYIAYGKVFLSFGEDGRLSQVTIHMKR